MHFLKSVLAMWLLDIFLITVEGSNPYLKTCSASDPALAKCLTKSAITTLPKIIAGIPGLDLPSIEVVKIEDIHYNLAMLNLSLINNVIHYASSKVKFFELNQEKKYIDFRVNVKGHILSNYNIEGRLIILPVSGNGNSRIDINEVEIRFYYTYELQKGKDGKDYIKFTKQEANLTVFSMGFNFENLFNGNQVLGQTVNAFMNENWALMLKEFGEPITKNILKIYKRQMYKFFTSIPFEYIVEV